MKILFFYNSIYDVSFVKSWKQLECFTLSRQIKYKPNLIIVYHNLQNNHKKIFIIIDMWFSWFS